MKSLLSKTFLFFAGLFISAGVWGDRIPATGEWYETGLRSSVPAPPDASIDGNILSIYFQDALENLIVTVVDLNGNVVYQQTISGGFDYTREIALPLNSGNYRLMMTHVLGYRVGAFTIY